MNDKVTKFGSNSTFTLTDDLSIRPDPNAGPFNRFPGFTFSSVTMTGDAPHDGEMHPDGDELLYVVSGRIEVTLEFDNHQTISVAAGEGLIVPKGIWHKVHLLEPGDLITLSAGPGFEFRHPKN